MVTLAAVAAISIFATLASTAVSVSENKKAARHQDRAERTRRKEAKAVRDRQRQKAEAEASRARAKIRADAISRNLGVGGGSGTSAVQQGIGGITSQLSSNLGFLNQIEGLENQRFDALGQANRARGRASTALAIGSAVSSTAGSFA